MSDGSCGKVPSSVGSKRSPAILWKAAAVVTIATFLPTPSAQANPARAIQFGQFAEQSVLLDCSWRKGAWDFLWWILGEIGKHEVIAELLECLKALLPHSDLEAQLDAAAACRLLQPILKSIQMSEKLTPREKSLIAARISASLLHCDFAGRVTVIPKSN